MKIYWRVLLVIVFIGFLVLVRQYEHDYFYDPFMAFFEGNFTAGEGIPYGWILNLVLRFILNTLISLAILYFSFLKWSVVKFSALLYVIMFAVLFPIFIFLMGKVQFDDYLAVFYVRRFLVHPILLLVLIPAFYYQKMKGR